MGKNAQKQGWEKKAGMYTFPHQGALNNENNTPCASLQPGSSLRISPPTCCLHVRQEACARGAVLAVFGANTAVWAKQTTEEQRRVQTNRVGCPVLNKMPQVWKCLRG